MTQRNLRWGWKGLRREVALGRLRARGEVLPSVGGGPRYFPLHFPLDFPLDFPLCSPSISHYISLRISPKFSPAFPLCFPIHSPAFSPFPPYILPMIPPMFLLHSPRISPSIPPLFPSIFSYIPPLFPLYLLYSPPLYPFYSSSISPLFSSLFLLYSPPVSPLFFPYISLYIPPIFPCSPDPIHPRTLQASPRTPSHEHHFSLPCKQLKTKKSNPTQSPLPTPPNPPRSGLSPHLPNAMRTKHVEQRFVQSSGMKRTHFNATLALRGRKHRSGLSPNENPRAVKIAFG